MTTYTPGIHAIPEDEYFALPYVSNSDLLLLARSPAHYYAQRVDPNRIEKPRSPALIAGKILHCAILEPDTFASRYVVVPEGAPPRPQERWRNAKNPSAETVQAFDWWDRWTEANQGREVIPIEHWRKYRAIAESVRKHEDLAAFLEDGQAEASVIAEDTHTGLMMRCRPDWMCEVEDTLVIIDLKSCEDARIGPFQRKAYGYGYFHQAVTYKHIVSLATGRPWNKILFLIAPFEKEPPYAVKLYELSADALQRTIATFNRNLNLMKKCRDENVWPAYSTDIERLHLPAWASDDIEAQVYEDEESDQQDT